MVPIIDWYSRYIVDWELSDSLYTDFVISTVERALQKAKPDIMNSYQACQFTGDAYTGLLNENTVKISMDGKGRAVHNIITERFWRTLKTEEVSIPPQGKQGKRLPAAWISVTIGGHISR